MDSIFKGLIRGARNVAVMGDLDTNPENMFRSMIEESVQAARERTDARMVDRLYNVT